MKKFVVTKNYDTTQLEDEWVILNTDTYTVTTLNQVAGFCWLLLKEPNTIDSIIYEVKKHYHSSEEPKRDDIEAFLLEMMEFGLVQYAS